MPAERSRIVHLAGVGAMALLFPPEAPAQPLLINELQAAGAPGDRVELFNAGSEAIDLEGMVLVAGTWHTAIRGPLVVPGNGCRVLWLDRRPELGLDHLELKLPREGGSLMLITADGSTILDLFSWPALRDGISIGRVPDGEDEARYFEQPTFGASNAYAQAFRSYSVTPQLHRERPGANDSLEIALSGDAATSIRFTLDGTAPGDEDHRTFQGPFRIGLPAVIRAVARTEDRLCSPEACWTLLPVDRPFPTVSLVMDPADLWDREKGIDVAGSHDNFSRTGRAWEREAFVQADLDSVGYPVGVRIAGSGSRSAPKRSYKLRVRGTTTLRSPGCSGMHECMLRADATPHAFLHNCFMEAVVGQSGARVDVQPSFPCQLLVNGQDHGLYRVMPAKNAEWLQKYHAVEAVDLLSGPSAEALEGDREHFERSMRALQHGATMDSLERSFDIGSLIDLACFDLYTGRADHDINVRCWRPKATGGRWRWILFDMDLWTTAEENSVERFASTEVLEAPFVPRLLQHRQLRDRLVQRMTALLHSSLSASAATHIVDSLFSRYSDLMRADHRCWKDSMYIPTPEESWSTLRDFVGARPAEMMAQLGAALDQPLRDLELRVEPAGAGRLLMDDQEITRYGIRMKVLSEVPLYFEARALDGFEFNGWKEVRDRSSIIEADPRTMRTLTAVFRPSEPSSRHGLQQAGE